MSHSQRPVLSLLPRSHHPTPHPWGLAGEDPAGRWLTTALQGSWWASDVRKEGWGKWLGSFSSSEKLSNSPVLNLLVLVGILYHIPGFLFGSSFFWAVCHLLKKIISSESRMALVSHFTSLGFLRRGTKLNQMISEDPSDFKDQCFYYQAGRGNRIAISIC